MAFAYSNSDCMCILSMLELLGYFSLQAGLGLCRRNAQIRRSILFCLAVICVLGLNCACSRPSPVLSITSGSASNWPQIRDLSLLEEK